MRARRGNPTFLHYLRRILIFGTFYPAVETAITVYFNGKLQKKIGWNDT